MGAVIPFAFEAHQVRVLERDEQPWFVAADVCAALGIQNATQATARLDTDERSMFNIGRQGDAIAVNEGGLYTLVLRCRDAMTPGTVAWRFRKWVTSEVLPALRRRGRYALVEEPESTPFDPAMLTAANGLVRTAMRLGGTRAGRVVWERLGLPSFAVIPGADEAERLLAVIRGAGHRGISTSDLSNRVRWISADRRAELLDALVGRGEVECDVLAGSPEGGPRRRIYRALG